VRSIFLERAGGDPVTRPFAFVLAAALAAAPGPLALADDQPQQSKPAHSHRNLQGPAKERHEAMERVGDAMKVLGKMAKGQAAFDASVVNSQATTILERLEQASKLFPPGSDEGETKARPEIWSDRAGFDKTMKDAQAAAKVLQDVKDEAGFRPALGSLGQRCKACHDKYRMPDEH
jgi:cytochrome c556